MMNMSSQWSRKKLSLVSDVIYACAPEAIACGMKSLPAPPHIATRFIVISAGGGQEHLATGEPNEAFANSTSCPAVIPLSRSATMPQPVTPSCDGDSILTGCAPSIFAIDHETPFGALSMEVWHEYMVTPRRNAWAITLSTRLRPSICLTPRNISGWCAIIRLQPLAAASDTMSSVASTHTITPVHCSEGSPSWYPELSHSSW